MSGGRAPGVAAAFCAALLVSGLACPAAAEDPPLRLPRERVNQLAFFAGRHIDNTWQEVFDTSEQYEWADAGLVGLALGREWRRPDGAFSFGFEAQIDWQFGDQYLFEVNLPVFMRYYLPKPVPALRSLAFGLGPSYASNVPDYEVDSRGDSQQFLMYWTMEAEFGPKDAANSGFIRLHHRSGMFGVVADEGASNALVVGMRHRW